MAGISSPPRCRAKRACRRCNLRRVKCNVMESQPCDNCDRANAKCEVLASRRGKHLQTRLSRPKSDSENGRTDADYETRQSETDRPGDRIDSPSVNHDSNGSAYCMSEISNAQARDDTEQLFLGESATLRCVYDTAAHSGDDGSPDKNTLLQFPLPQKLPSETILSDWEAQRRERRIGYLRADGIFDMPLPSVCERLFAAYFKWFHPCFPIIEPADLLAKYNAKTLSLLLSLAIYSLAAAHCDDEILAEASFVSRYQAQYTFYSKAKDLYEADYEADKTTIIQALFLMSFWRSGRLLDKHTRYWLGMALTLAQSSAMHRALPNTQPNQAKIRRRIWWCIYMREFQCSASLGLPTRIRDCDCDIEPLQPEDLYDDRPCESTRLQWTLPPQTPAQVSYAIEMSKLAKLVGRIVDAEYVPHRMTTVTRQQLKADLLEWECQLPEHMRSHVRLGGRLDFYAAMLHIVYNNLLILLSRNSYIRNDADGDIALQAACTNSSFIGDLLTRNLVPHADGYLISCLFNTLCIHVIHLRRSRDTARTVAEQRARFCVLALKELQERWKVTVCLLQLRLFFQALDHSTAKRLQGDAGENLPADDSTGTFMDVLPPATSVLPELWDLHYSGPGWGDQSHLPCLDSTHGADVSGLFQWPFATDGVGELLGHTTNLSP